MVTKELCKSIDFHVSLRYPKNNFINIVHYPSKKKYPGYAASILISVFDILYRANPKLWQRLNYDDYRVEYDEDNWCKAISNIDNRHLYVATDFSFRVSSPQTCIELQRHIECTYNKEIQLMNVPYDARKYLCDRME